MTGSIVSPSFGRVGVSVSDMLGALDVDGFVLSPVGVSSATQEENSIQNITAVSRTANIRLIISSAPDPQAIPLLFLQSLRHDLPTEKGHHRF